MLIFDSFPDKDKAKEFAEKIKAKYNLDCVVCGSQDESNAIDPFPFVLYPPIVLVQRPNPYNASIEQRVEKAVRDFGGEYAGT